MINNLMEKFYSLALSAIEKLPDIEGFNVPAEVNQGIGKIFQFVGWIMPYNLYAPLIIFILSLTSFRIVYAVYLHFKK
ncbi:MAG: hypothetical protein NC253_01495 [Ruminococcus sp.]|nr:hypothetical protein [Ruminococcus sp.]MCM1381161.1 hypothetical protein [Muribaculaceae bacterium]MCM1479652.1 hypothetical protein [Muribaculaceae bacterium]